MSPPERVMIVLALLTDGALGAALAARAGAWGGDGRVLFVAAPGAPPPAPSAGPVPPAGGDDVAALGEVARSLTADDVARGAWALAGRDVAGEAVALRSEQRGPVGDALATGAAAHSRVGELRMRRRAALAVEVELGREIAAILPRATVPR